MDNTNDILDLIKRTKKKDFQEYVIQYQKECIFKNNKWNRDNPELHQKCVKKYYIQEKGAYACSKRNASRRGKFKSACADLSWQEKKLIGRFYKNCPQGYEVDHIIPIAKGGKHCLSNLQYLTKEENRRKSAKINFS